jgi:2-octaprenyl-6-methoxyphenol hydroxylase
MKHESRIKQYDIGIVGGGLVGSVLAIACSTLGLNVLLIERKAREVLQPENPLDFRHIALSHGSKIILNSMGIWPHLEKYTHPIENIHVSELGRWGFTRLCAHEQNMPALGYVIAYHDFQAALSSLVETCQQIDYFTEASLKDSVLLDKTWQLTIHQKETEQIAEVKLLIGADGLDSPLRTQHQIDVFEKSYDQVAIVTTLRVSHPQATTAFERFTQEGPIAILPVGNDRVALIWAVKTETARHYKDLSDKAFIEKIQSFFGFRLGYFLSLGARQQFPLKLSIAQSQINTRLLFLGSAVHHLHPIAAQGFNLALRDIATLMDVIKSQPENIGDAKGLNDYLLYRQKDQKRTIKFTDGLVLLFSNNFLPLAFLRNALMSILELSLPAKIALGKYGAGRLGKLSSLARGKKL